jgi:hypothetical protein
VGVAAGDQWHDRRIHDAQPVDASNPQVRIDDGVLVHAHLARAHRVIKKLDATADVRFDVVVGLDAGAGEDLGPDRVGQRRLGGDLAGGLHPGDQGGNVFGLGQVIAPDARLRGRIGRAKRDAPAALGGDQDRPHRHGVPVELVEPVFVEVGGREVVLEVRGG